MMPVTPGGKVSIRAQHPSISPLLLSSGSSTSQPWEAGQAELLLGVGRWGQGACKGWVVANPARVGGGHKEDSHLLLPAAKINSIAQKMGGRLLKRSHTAAVCCGLQHPSVLLDLC